MFRIKHYWFVMAQHCY